MSMYHFREVCGRSRLFGLYGYFTDELYRLVFTSDKTCSRWAIWMLTWSGDYHIMPGHITKTR